MNVPKLLKSFTYYESVSGKVSYTKQMEDDSCQSADLLCRESTLWGKLQDMNLSIYISKTRAKFLIIKAKTGLCIQWQSPRANKGQ